MTYKPRVNRSVSCSRIVIELPLRQMGLSDFTTDRLSLDAKDIIRQIERHVDLPYHAQGPYWDPEWESKCVHCGYDPEPDEGGWPCCCDAAMDEAQAAGVPDPDEEGGAA